MRANFMLPLLLIAFASTQALGQEVKISPVGEARLVAIGENLVVNANMVNSVRYRPIENTERGNVSVDMISGGSMSVQMSREQWSKLQAELIASTKK